MAYSRLFSCDRCSADVLLVHAQEWQTDSGGRVVPYPGHGPIGGLRNLLWCRRCRAVQSFAFVTLNPPGDHPVIAYAEAQRLGCTGEETGPCPVCGDALTWEVAGERCPACNEGTLQAIGEWEDGA